MFRPPMRFAKTLSPPALMLVIGVSLAVTAPTIARAGGHRHFKKVGFVLHCGYVKSLPDDPVLRHGRPGHSPGNDFYAAKNVDANSTFTTLRRSNGTCTTRYDTSAYFQPQLLLHGHAQTPKGVLSYYEVPNDADPRSIRQWPDRFSMVANASHTYWGCGGGRTPHKRAPYNCADYGSTGGITAFASFPTCWDGANPSRPTDTVYPVKKVCPPGFKTRIPQLIEGFGWRINNGTDATFTTGDPTRFRAEFMNAWDPAYLGMLMATCINANRACGDIQNSGDSPPRMDAVKIRPIPAYATNTLTAEPVHLRDPDGDDITCSYAWRVNGERVGDDSIQLDPSLFKIGDVVAVTVTPTDSWGVQGFPVTSAPVTVLTDLAAKAPGSPGGLVTLHGGGFKPNEAVAITVDSPSGPSLGKVRVDADGAFTGFHTTIPTPLSGGAHTIHGIGSMSHIHGLGRLMVVPCGRLTPGDVPAGGTAIFSGAGFAPHEAVSASFPGGLVVHATADRSGSVSVSLLSPAVPGPRNTVTASAPSGTVTVSYVVDATMTMPTKGEPRIPIPFSITGFGAKETVDALIDNVRNGQTFTTNAKGSYSGTLSITENFGHNYMVRMTGESSGQTKMVQVDLPGYASVDPPSGPVGTVVTVSSLFGWVPGETVHLHVAGTKLPNVIADRTGSVITTFVAPQHAPGNISVVLSDTVLDISPSTRFAIIG